LVYAYASLSCDFVEPWSNGREIGFSIFDECKEHIPTWRYVTEVLGDDAPADKRYFYRLGYCPAVVSGNLLVAKTLLLPGMKGTPERDWYMKHVAKTPSARRKFHEDVLRLTGSKPCTTGDFSLIKQFHDAGIPQVISPESKPPTASSPGEELALEALRRNIDTPPMDQAAMR
jgi:hypothetical protein